MFPLLFLKASCSKKSCTENTQKEPSTGQQLEEVTMPTKQTPLPTQMSLDITTTDHLEINQPKDSFQMNFPVIPISSRAPAAAKKNLNLS